MLTLVGTFDADIVLLVLILGAHVLDQHGPARPPRNPVAQGARLRRRRARHRLEALPDGCAFHPRCGIVDEACARAVSPLLRLEAGRACACYKAERP
jgi:hypothetical protein